MDNRLVETWFDMSIQKQISNIGSEVNRALMWREKGNRKREIGFCYKAIEFLGLTIADPKNHHRVGELLFCIEELQDYFIGNNIYATTPEKLRKYYDAFIYDIA